MTTTDDDDDDDDDDCCCCRFGQCHYSCTDDDS